MKTTTATLAIACFAVTLAGCGNVEDPQSISEVSRSSSSLDLGATQYGETTNVDLWLYPQAQPGRCAILTDRAKATINGTPVDLWPGDGFITYYSGELLCHPASIHAEIPTAPGLTTIVISDDTGEIRVTADLTSQRTWSVVPEGQSELHVGDTVELRWLNPTDQLVPGKAWPRFLSDLPEREIYVDTNTVAVSGGVVSFTVPDNWGLEPGAWELWMSTEAQVQPNECLGLASCAVTLQSHFGQPITIVAP